MATVGRAEIHQAVLEGNVLALEAYLSNHSDCNIINDKLHNRTLLHCAAYAGSLDCTEALLRSKSIDLNRPDKFGLSPLQCAGTHLSPRLNKLYHSFDSENRSKICKQLKML